MNHKIFLFTAILSACAAEEPKETLLQATPAASTTPVAALTPVSQSGASVVTPQSSSLASTTGKNAESQTLKNITGDRLGEAEGGAGISIKGTGTSKGKPIEKSATSKPDPLDSAEATGGEATVSEGLDKDVVRRVIRRAIPGIKFCYEQALASKPELKGKVVINFSISGRGEVVSATTAKGIDAAVDGCVERKIQQLVFPAPEGGKVVFASYPFSFSAAN